ncbi:MAG: 1-acyl-sn-glycerol-3-phosphate acyltransferase [Myxococcota bacterium]
MNRDRRDVRAQAQRYGTAMLRQFGWFHWLLGLRRPLDQMQLDDASAERVRQAALRGPIVYVLLQANNLDHLALNRVLNARRLPLSIWANDVTQFFWQPVVEAWQGLFRRAWDRLRGRAAADPVTSGFVSAAVAQNEPVTVFLESSDSLWRRVLTSRPEDPLPALFAAQAHSERPVQLLPVAVIWQRGLDRPVHPALRAVLPDPERPWWGIRLLKLAWSPGDNLVLVGDPVDLATFTSRVPDSPDRRRTLFVLLRRYLRRESAVVRGPHLPNPPVLRKMVLNNPPMRALAQEEAARTHSTIERVDRKMEREYDRIAAHMRWWVIRILDVMLRPLWTIVYSGVDAPEADMERIRQAMRQGSAVVLPSHKSHFDYLLLAWVFYRNKLTLPFVVAGDNLAIPVVAFFLRSAGGFFIKRSFSGEHLHPAIFSRYLRELVHHGVPIEFYLEGGRTRSGKLLPPKVGVLGMILEAAALRPHKREVTLLPVALAYEQVAEQRSYLRELGGKDKQRENLGQVARATQILRRRLGRVYLRVGEPIALSTWVDSTPDQPAWSDRTDEDRKRVLHELAHRVMHRVGNHTVLLPTTLVALAMLAHHRRGIDQPALMARAQRFLDHCVRHGVPQATRLEHFEEAVHLTLTRLTDQRMIEHFEVEDVRVWAVRVDKRLELDFFKNQGLHTFAPAGLVIAALRARPTGPIDQLELLDDVEFLRSLWAREFIFEPRWSPAELLQHGIDDLVALGALTQTDDGRIQPQIPERLGEIHGLFRPFIEAYHLVLTEASHLENARMGRKEWVRTLMQRADAFMAAGHVSRPEALSLITLENAVKQLSADRVFSTDNDVLTADIEQCQALAARLAPMVGR